MGGTNRSEGRESVRFPPNQPPLQKPHSVQLTIFHRDRNLGSVGAEDVNKAQGKRRKLGV